VRKCKNQYEGLGAVVTCGNYLVIANNNKLAANWPRHGEIPMVDIKLDNISGLDLVRRLAAAGFKLPVIFMTGRVDETIRSQAMQLGCCIAYLKKPFPANF
jgi:FixJ family two-component response regulator